MASSAVSVGSLGARRPGQGPQVEVAGTAYAPGRETFRGWSVIRDSLNIRVARRSTSWPITYQRPLEAVSPHGSSVRRSPSR